MTPTRRTPQQRDRRFARVRRLTQAVLLSSGVVSAVLVGYVASAAKPVSKTPVTVPSTATTPVTSATNAGSGSYTTPTTAPVTTTTVCTTTPSGTVTCY